MTYDRRHNLFDFRMRVLRAALILAVVGINVARAQDTRGEEHLPKAWGRLGLGIVGDNDFLGFGGTVGIQYSSPAGLISIQYLGAGKITVDPAVLGTNRLTTITEMNALWGIETEFSILYVSASTGLGVLWGRERGVRGDESFTVAAVPVDAQVMIRPFRVVGFGGMLTSSINSKRSITALMVVLQIGRLR